MTCRPGEPSAQVRIGLVAGGADGLALLRLLLGWPAAKIVIVIDPLPDTLVLRQAQSLGIPVATRHLEIFNRPPVDVVLEATGQAAILDELLRARPPGVEVIDARSLGFLRHVLRDLTEALEQQTATSEILRVISSSPTDVQPVLEAVVEHAARLSGVPDAEIFRVDGEVLRLAAKIGPHPGLSVGEERPISRNWVTGRAVADRSLVHVHDLSASEAEFPEGAAYAKAYGHRTTLATPLLREGVPIGAILVRGTELRPFTDKQIELLKTFADQAVIAIENVRLFTELQARNRKLTEVLEQQTATAEILRVISSSPTDEQPVFDAIVRSVVRLCNALFSNVQLFDGQLMHLVALHNYTPEGRQAMQRAYPMPPGRGQLAGRAIMDRRIVHVHDVLDDPQYSHEIALAGGLRSMLSVPMFREEKPIGVITVVRGEPGPFSDTQVELLKTFAAQAVIAIENVRLFNELQARTREFARSVEELQALSQVGQAVSSTLDLETVLTTIVTRAVQLAGTNGGAVYEYDEETETFRLRASHRLEAELVEALAAQPIRLGQGATGQAAARRVPVEIPDILDEQLFRGLPARSALERLGYRSVLAVPLLREQRIIGALTVWRREPGSFAPEIVRLLETFATQSVLAIQNARLFREIDDKSHALESLSRNMEQLYRLSTALQEPLSLGEQLTRVLDAARQVVRLKPIDRERLAGVLRTLCGNRPTPHVLVVDDDETTRAVIRQALERAGWSLAEAENGRVALERVAERAPDVIVLDLLMPELNGFEFLTALRSNPAWRSVPVVVLTAMDLSAEDRRILNGAVKRVLQKGAWDRDQLLGEIGRVLANAVAGGGARPASTRP